MAPLEKKKKDPMTGSSASK